MSLIKIKFSYLFGMLLVFGFAFLNSSMPAQAEQYSTGSHTVISTQGVLTISVGHVSHFNANDFYVYSFMFQPKGGNELNQVPRVEKADDSKMLFTVQTRHTADKDLFDAKIISDGRKIQLVTASMETGETLADDGPVTLTTYDLVKLDDYERWVFLRQGVKKIAPKASVEKLLDNAAKLLNKK